MTDCWKQFLSGITLPNTAYHVPFRILLIQRQENAADLSEATTSGDRQECRCTVLKGHLSRSTCFILYKNLLDHLSTIEALQAVAV